MRVCIMSLVLFLAIGFGFAGETSAAVSDNPWKDLAGMAEELQAEDLELRDELIAAHLAYLSSLGKALAEIDAMPAEDPRLPLAWSRVEYLLETSFRLLDKTGEHEAFLQATAALRPAEAPIPEEIGLEEGRSDPGNRDGGLEFFDAAGARLHPVLSGGAIRLADGGGHISTTLDGITARPRDEVRPPHDSYIPLIRARAAWLRALALEKLGKTRDAGVETENLGLIRDWLLLGPLDIESEAQSYLNFGLDDVYEALDASRPSSGKAGPVTWKAAATSDPLGRLYLDSYFRTPGVKSALALALVYSPEDTGAVIRFGSNSSAIVCVNHIQSAPILFSGHADPDREAFAVWLRKGWNTVFIRSASVDDDWALAVRLTGLDGNPFPGHVFKPDDGNVALFLDEAKNAARRSRLEQHYRPEWPAALGGVSVLSSWLETRDEDARAYFYLGSFLVAKRMMEGAERFQSENVLHRAVELSGGDPFFTLMTARSVDSGVEGPDREENLRLVLLKSVADLGSAAALTDIGRLYLDVMRQPRRANAYVELALKVNPMSLRAGVLDYDAAVAMNWRPVAKTILERLVKRHPFAAPARLRLGRVALAEGRYRQALSEFHAILAVDADNREAVDGAVMALGMLGQTSAAVELLTSQVERFPHAFAMRIKLAELYRTLGRDQEARTVLQAALDMAPDDPAAQAMRRDLDRETYAEGKDAGDGEIMPPRRKPTQELDMSPPAVTPTLGWEYLYFQVEDRMARYGAIDRTVSFALRIYTDRAAKALRHLGFWLDRDFESGVVNALSIAHPDGTRQYFTPPSTPATGGHSLNFYLPPLEPGMIVEAEVQIRRERVPFLGDYFGQIAPLAQQAPVRLSRYMFTSSKERRVFFRPVNGAPEAMVVESPDGNEVTRIWEMSNLDGCSPEPGSPGRHELMPCVEISSFSDWDEFARWYWRLIGVQYHTPPELRMLARSVAGDEVLPMVKLDLAAAWVAKNIGHRDWEYGPYAFRPINARSILSRLSADGKDRTLLLCLLAREFGLEAWPVLARMRNRRFPPMGSADLSLPLLDHFNHSLVMVKSQLGGDVFMDAANPLRPPGVMPSQLFGSPGVAIRPNSAEMVLIPDGGVSACVWEETAEMEVDDDGSVIWEQSVTGVGTAAEHLRQRFKGETGRTEAWESFLESIGAAPTASQASFHEDPAAPASASFTGRVRLRRLASVADGRVLLAVPPLPGEMVSKTNTFSFPLSLEDLAIQGVREHDLLLPHGFRVVRRLTVTYPDEWHLANQPEAFAREYSFGAVNLGVDSQPGVLHLSFSVEVPEHRLAADDFSDFREMSALMRRWLQPLIVWEKP